MNPRVRKILEIKNFELYLEFTSGEKGAYDCSELLDFGLFKELKSPSYFRQASVQDGTVVWPHDQDICPDTLYLDSKKK